MKQKETHPNKAQWSAKGAAEELPPAKAYDTLLEELLKESPDQEKIKNLINLLGFKYSKDTLYMIDELLRGAPQFKKKKPN